MCASDFKTAFLMLLAAMLLAAPAVAAEKKADPAKEQARRMQQANRKLEQEKAALVQEKTAVEGKMKESADKLGAVQRKVADANRRVAELERVLESLGTEKEALTGKLTETEKQFVEVTGKFRVAEEERKRLVTLAAQQKQSIASCEDHNAKLHVLGVALLEKYKSKGCFDAMLQGEPFIGFKQVEVENFVEDNRDKLDEHKLGRPARR